MCWINRMFWIYFCNSLESVNFCSVGGRVFQARGLANKNALLLIVTHLDLFVPEDGKWPIRTVVQSEKRCIPYSYTITHNWLKMNASWQAKRRYHQIALLLPYGLRIMMPTHAQIHQLFQDLSFRVVQQHIKPDVEVEIKLVDISWEMFVVLSLQIFKSSSFVYWLMGYQAIGAKNV